ncbi:uncharacterized protein lbhl [Brachyhypopomus gauderio]|uniref:uncharacterized protein lbhl n=1 Tax=Brachyhypopomus gauderio TaxID=698409 RepID=UPI0040429821
MEHSSNPGEPGGTSMDGCVESPRRQDSGTFELPQPDTRDRAFQIFPDLMEVVLTLEGSQAQTEQGKERLPSIVVEPVDVSEVESGELRWPPEPEEDEEDEGLFLEQSFPPACITDWGDEEQEEVDEDDEEQRDEEESTVIVNTQQDTLLLDLQLSDYTDDTPSLSPESESALNRTPAPTPSLPPSPLPEDPGSLVLSTAQRGLLGPCSDS